MPIYELLCPSCDLVIDKMCRVDDRKSQYCDECEGPLTPLISHCTLDCEIIPGDGNKVN